MADTIGTLMERALDALASLGELGEDVEDEWTYVTDLVGAQRARLEEIADRRGSEPSAADRAGAVALAIEEIGRIADPHRAIDWLSTFPDLVALAIDEPIGASGAGDSGSTSWAG